MATSAPLSQRSPEETNNPGQDLAERELNPDRQTTPKGDPTDPRGNDTAAGDSSDPRDSGGDELRDKENAGDSSGSDQSFYRQPSSSVGRGRFSLKGRVTKKRGLFGGGILALLASAIIGSFLLSGPAEMVQLSHVLQHPFAKSDSDTHNRLGRLYRYAKSGQPGETRVSKLGSKIFGDTIDQLKEKGVTIKNNRLTGRPTETTYETQKLEKDFPELKGASTADRKVFLADKLGLDVGQIEGSGTLFTVDQTEMNVRSANLLTKSTVGLLDKNGLVSAIKSRELAKFFDLPSLFHPLSRAIADKENQILNNAQKAKQQQQDEQDREAKLTEDVESNGVTAVKEINDESSKYNSTAMKALLLTGGVCFVRSITGDIVTVNHDLVVLPAAVRATDLIAVGEQAESGQDLDLGQLGQIEKSLTDSSTGKTIWQGQALNSLETGGKTDSSLTDITPDHRQAFSGDTTAANIKSFVDKALTISLPFGVKVDAATYACSPAGILLQIGGGLFLSVSSLIGEVGSGGTLTPAVVGLWTAKEGASFAISAVAMHFISGFILNGNTARLAANAFSGPVGGNLLAYGARAAANTAAIASGGIALGNQASTILATQEQQDQQQFHSLSLVQRLFNPYDYRSAVGKLIQTTSGSPLHNLARIGNIFTGFSSLFGHSLSAIAPRAAAAGTPYNWGFPQYGLPDSLLNDTNLDNPYDNAAQVASLLDNAGCATNGDCSWLTKARACFGVKISPVTDSDNAKIWDVIPDHEINTSEDSYISAHCNDTDENWKRVEMFVFDTTTMKAAACYQGDDQSCADLTTTGPTSSSPTASSPGSLPAGSSQDLAKQLLPFIQNGKIVCGSAASGSGPADCSDIQNTATGQPLGGNCQVSALTPHLLGLILGLVRDDGWSLGISAICSNHGLESDGPYGGHSYGSVADFSVLNGAGGLSAATNEKFVNDVAALLSAIGGSFGQVATSGTVDTNHGQCHLAYPSQNNTKFTLFPDGCNHQHVRAAP
jgi:hypothetical protein